MDLTKREEGRIGEESNAHQLQSNNDTRQANQQRNYVKNLEDNYEELQAAFLQLTSQYARLQFRIRQLKQAAPTERESLINELNRLAFNDCNNDFNTNNNNDNNSNNCEGFPNEEFFCLQRGNQTLNDIKRKQHQLIQQLRNQIDHLYDIRSLLNEHRQSEQNTNERNMVKQNANERVQRFSRSNSTYSRKSKSQNHVPVLNGTNEGKSNATIPNKLRNNISNRTTPPHNNKPKEQSNTL